ncbi:hypothetical protein K1X12_00710 [Hyphomonas sp. WL0036]|uniref:hypothetical protein n=1 Tax=Hyphomonas sediminis TaxID=2866160 RepID=UPI001C7E8066|nr:hypothetical protein [Hyphomonas sediminis]MBY9065396.1 hypothetical protein [Hyphomonas sediminis]
MLVLALAGGVARAEDACETDHLPKALEASLRPTNTAEQFQQALTEIDGQVSRCPDHPWINMMGAVMDMRAYDVLVRGNNNQINQSALNYLVRAYDRSNKYIAAPAESRADRIAVQTGSGRGSLTYSAAAENRKDIVSKLMTLARLGTVHPYIAAETPPACTGWLAPDSQTVGYGMDTEADLIFRPFLDAAADACSDDPVKKDDTPVAVKAYAYTHLVRTGGVTDPAQAAGLLHAARDARDTYLYMNGGRFGIILSKITSKELDGLLRKHGVDAQAGLLPRQQWFTAEHIRGEEVAFSLAWTLSDTWAGLAAEIEAGDKTVASAATVYTNFVSGILAEGREAGLEGETRMVILHALSDVQESRVRTHRMGGYDLPPQWLFDVLKNTYGPQKEG